jgi:hypothetical protein
MSRVTLIAKTILWALATSVVLALILVTISSRRFDRNVALDVERLWEAAPPARLDLDRLNELPTPVQTYLTHALGNSPRPVQFVRFRHGGQFRTKLDGPWQPISGEQYESLDPPGFIWWGRLRVMPGVWIDARDRSVNGVGNMFVSFESTITLFDRSGPELDQGAMLRLLSDFVLFPTIMLDERYVSWVALDDKHVRATLRVKDNEVSGTFEFGADGLPRSFSAERYFDSGRGPAKLLPWSGEYQDYRQVDGLLVPHHFIGYWHVEGERIPHVDFQLEAPEYDVPRPFDGPLQAP